MNYILVKEHNRFKIFVVDENFFCLNMYQQYLLNLGYCDIHIFSSTAECVNQLKLKPELVFVDYDIDEMKGVELLKTIKNHNPDIYVVMLSGVDDKQAAVTAHKHGAFDFIIKGETEDRNIASVVSKINSINTYLRKRTF